MQRRLDEFQICFGVESRSGVILRSELVTLRVSVSSYLVLRLELFVELEGLQIWLLGTAFVVIVAQNYGTDVSLFYSVGFGMDFMMLVLEAERVTPVSLISLVGSVSRYDPSG
ncbi:hypothetical protein F511_19605 [Dorcoceras hygrometricum]|uniref:Uncharacterized protein n=1 Tax=Dorcoceras hygrometricum TaxID=472368 RepID=A0A2Z7CGZ7_9LAMI|nr:hypothetical protein F511_19605 [Dorcoceras hygrometricum]